MCVCVTSGDGCIKEELCHKKRKTLRGVEKCKKKEGGGGGGGLAFA